MKVGRLHFEMEERMSLQTTQSPPPEIFQHFFGQEDRRSPIHCVVFHGEAFDLYGEVLNFAQGKFRFVLRSIKFSTGSSIFARRSFVSLCGATDFARTRDRFARRTVGSGQGTHVNFHEAAIDSQGESVSLVSRLSLVFATHTTPTTYKYAYLLFPSTSITSRK